MRIFAGWRNQRRQPDMWSVVEEPQFREMYAACADELFTYARRRLPPADAEDLVADVFLVAWRRRDQLPAEPVPWLFGVARRTLANRRRGQDRAGALVRRLGREPVIDELPVDGNEGVVGVLRALSSLGDDDRDLLELLAWEGLSHAQLAGVFGVSRGAIKVRIHRARRRLAAALNDLDGPTTGGPDHPSTVQEAGHA